MNIGRWGFEIGPTHISEGGGLGNVGLLFTRRMQRGFAPATGLVLPSVRTATQNP